MDTLFFPTKNDFKTWIKEALKESLNASVIQNDKKVANPQQEQLISRKDVSLFLGISMVTLNEWMKKGLPNHKVNGRVYFLRSEVLEYMSEVLEYIKTNRRKL